MAMVPMARFNRAEEIARLVAFPAFDKAGHVTGANYPVDAGMPG